MCGITGFINHADKINDLEHLLAHRGPDDNGIFSDNHINFIHTRLSVIDLTDAGHQPMFYSPDKGASSEKHHPDFMKPSKVGIIYNGEIFNYKEIRSLLQSKGYIFTTQSDTELILASYLEWGTECIQRFNGMWAFCIYDKVNEILFLSRDRFGIKPLYYYVSDNEFIFSSELKPIYKLIPRIEIDPSALNHYFIMNTSPTDRTIVNGIQKFPAASCMVFDLKTKKMALLNSYWNSKFEEKVINEETAKSRITDILSDSVKRNMVSDCEVGAFLSGGIDSSIIVMLMKEYSEKVKTFSVRFDYVDYNESQYARIVSETFKTHHYEIEFNASDVMKLIDELPIYYDEPFGDSSMIPTFLVSKTASDHVKVVLSGTGSDEIFGGYDRYKEYIKLLKIRSIPKILRNAATSSYRKLNKDKAGKLKELLNEKDDRILYVKLLSDAFRNPGEKWYSEPLLEDFKDFFQNNQGINAMLSFDQKHYLFNDLLIKEDRATGAFGMEGRFPFLDHKLVEYANTLDNTLKINNKIGKYILKASYANVLPIEIIERKKKGFGVPLKHYFRNELKSYAEELIFGNLYRFPEFDKAYVKTLWDMHQSGQSNYASFFWNLIMLIKWHERYINT
jgi:asparagine synthase (glutamine-hydrolysing)